MNIDSMLIRRVLCKNYEREVYEPSVQRLIKSDSSDLEIEAYILELESQYPKNNRILINHDNMDIFRFGDDDIMRTTTEIFSKTYQPLSEFLSLECPISMIDESQIKFMNPNDQVKAFAEIEQYKTDLENYYLRMKDYKLFKSALNGDTAAQILIIVFNQCLNLFDRSSYEVSYLK